MTGPLRRIVDLSRRAAGRPTRSSRVALLALGMLAGCRTHDLPQYPSNYREYAYVANSGSATLTILDVVNLRVDREVPVGQNPVAVSASPTRNEVYVVNAGVAGGLGSLSIVDAARNAAIATIPLHRKPLAIDLDAAGSLAYIANAGSNSVSVVDLKARREIAQIGIGEEPVAVRLAPDGKTLIAANQRGNSVSIVDVAERRVRSIFPDCPGAADIAVLPDSSKAFIACAAGHQVMAIALAGAKDAPGKPDRLEALMDVGRGPVHLALKPDGGELFVSNSRGDSISEVDTSKNDVGGAYTIGDDPVRGLVSSDNALLYVANFRSQYVTLYSINEGKRLPGLPGLPGSIHVGDGPQALAFSDSGVLLFVVDNRSSDVAVIRTDTRAMIAILPTGRAPSALAVKAFTVQ